MNSALVIMAMVRESNNGGMMWHIIPATNQLAAGSLQMITILWTPQSRLSDHILCNMQLKTGYQRENATYVALVDINFLKQQVRIEYIRYGVNNIL